MNRKMISKIDTESESSEASDNETSYLSALMSNLLPKSGQQTPTPISTLPPPTLSDKKPTECRLDFIKNILKGNKLKPMIDFETLDTETANNTKLNKKIMDVRDLVAPTNVKLRYLKSGTTGHIFKAVNKSDKTISFAVKVSAYPKGDFYGGISNAARPENAEIRILQLLSQFVVKRSSPHFVLPLATFNTSITNFIKVPKKMVDLKDKNSKSYREFIQNYLEGHFENFVSVLVTEWCNGGDLLDYIRKNYFTMKLRDWRVIFFQILYTLAKIQEKYPTFRHNDLKANNIFVQLTNEDDYPDKNNQYCYTIGDVRFYIPNINLQIKISDFDFSCIDGVVENNKVNSDWTHKINITKQENKYYDVHYFFNTLITKRFFEQFYEGGAPPKIVEFIHRIIPEKFRNGSKYINKKCRIQVNTEYITPLEIIRNDPLFNKYRFYN